MRILLLICIGVTAAWVLRAAGSRPEAVLACTGGIAPFETLAGEIDLIVLGQTDLVGDSTNRAPKLRPRATSTPDQRTPTALPNPPSPAALPALDFDLAGIGATLRVTNVYVGPPTSELDLGWGTRAGLERQLREREAGNPPPFDTCGFAAFVPRYVLGAAYLVFMNEYQGILTSWGEFRVDGAFVVLNDEGLNRANNGFLYLEPATYDRYFSGIASNEDRTFITAKRIPLATVLRAVAGLRGDPSIAPPETGSAGLAAWR